MAAARAADPLRVWFGNLAPGISKYEIATCLASLGVFGSDCEYTRMGDCMLC